ncbi:MAG: hypothetical protein AAF298_19535 [Cyanobacteria bacterium P01_A01_bin.40]
MIDENFSIALADSSFDINESIIKFKPTDNESTLIAKDVAVVSNGNTNIYIGTNQVSSNNQDPILTSFTNGERDWITTDIETTGADGRGIALLWDSSDNLYAAFTTDGTQGNAEQDFRRFTDSGWLSSYGQGGGAKATVLLKIDPSSGAAIVDNGTFVSAVLSNGKTNTLVPTDLSFAEDGNLVLTADSYFNPRRVDTTRMNQTTPGSSPFNYTITFDPSLQVAQSAVSPGWDGVSIDIEDEEPVEVNLEITTVNRFYQYQKGFHFYTADANESSIIQRESDAGNLSYNYEGESFSALNSNLDSLTGAIIEDVAPVYRFFNMDTGAHLFTMDVDEKNYIAENLDNYSLEGIAYYAFAREQENIETTPLYRMLNNYTGSHLFTSDRQEFTYIQDNLDHFSLEADNGIAFYVMEI